MSTPRSVLDLAYGHLKKIQPGKILVEASEGLTVSNRIIRTFFQIGVRVNPFFFGDVNDVAYAAPGWARPSWAEAIYRIEDPEGQEVVVVPFDQRKTEEALPSVYRFGQVFRSAGNANDPVNGNLTFFASKRPTDADDLTSAFDAMWPEAYDELAGLELAAYMAAKDQLHDDLAYVVSERDRWLRLYLMFLEHETLNERREYGMPTPFNTASVVPIASLLTGGSSVELPSGPA